MFTFLSIGSRSETGIVPAALVVHMPFSWSGTFTCVVRTVVWSNQLVLPIFTGRFVAISFTEQFIGWLTWIHFFNKGEKRAFFFSNVKHTESSKPHFPSLFMHDIPCTVYLTVWHQLTCGWVKLKLIAAWLLWNESFKMGISVWLDVGFLFITELQKWQLSQDSVDRGRGCMLEGERGSL